MNRISRSTRAIARAVLSATALGAASSSIIAQAARMRPGLYELASEANMGGRAMKMPLPAVCVTAEDLNDWSRTVDKSGKDSTCKLTEYKPAGTTLTFVRVCTSGGEQTTYKGEVTFSPPDVYHSVTRITGAVLGGSTITTTAKRIGDCTK